MTTLAIPPVKACVFGAVGTLFDCQPLVDICREAVGEKAKDLVDFWRKKQAELARTTANFAEGLEIERDDFWRITSKSLDAALEAFKVKDAILRARLMQNYMHLPLLEDARAALQDLKAKGIKAFIFSNCTPIMLAGLVNGAGIRNLFDGFLSAGREDKPFKPAPESYAVVTEALELTPEEICFVSVDVEDLAGAADAHLQTVHIKRAGTPCLKPNIAKAEVTSLKQLTNILPTS